jgi:hypothetical protein
MANGWGKVGRPGVKKPAGAGRGGLIGEESLGWVPPPSLPLIGGGTDRAWGTIYDYPPAGFLPLSGGG